MKTVDTLRTEIKAISKLSKKITPGLWTSNKWFILDDDGEIIAAFRTTDDSDDADHPHTGESRRNAEFTTLSLAAVPRLSTIAEGLLMTLTETHKILERIISESDEYGGIGDVTVHATNAIEQIENDLAELVE